MNLDVEKVKAIATIVITAIANVANVLGFAMDADAWINVVLSIISAATIIYAWWKNQNLTVEAQEAQKVLNEMKAVNKLNEAQARLDGLITARRAEVKEAEDGAEN